MNLNEVIQLIERCSERMNVKYGDIVFDEWLIVHMGQTDRILAHSGPRGEEIVLDFGTDTEAIHKLLQVNSTVGDFGFTEEGHGTRFDAYTVIGKNLFVLWNRTEGATTHITQNRKWSPAQTELAAFADVVKKDPVQYSE